MRRDREEIVEHILEICKDTSSKTKIVYQANLNFKNATLFLDQLTDAGLLEASGPIRTRYKTTPKGLEFLEHIKAVNALFRQNDKWP